LREPTISSSQESSLPAVRGSKLGPSEQETGESNAQGDDLVTMYDN